MSAGKKIICIILCVVIFVFTPRIYAYAYDADAQKSEIVCTRYALKNEANEKYLTVSQSIDENMRNVITAELTDESGQFFDIQQTSIGYYLRPDCCIDSGRILNVDSEKVLSGHNVNIYDYYEETTLMWHFEEYDGAYIIRSADNSDCVLTQKDGNVIVSKCEYDEAQLWTLEKAKPLTEIVARGIDVSCWQYDIDWQKVAQSGVDFAIIRIGFADTMDEYFEANYKGAKQAGIDVGCYLYTYSENATQAKEEAQNVLSWLDGRQLEYPVYIDIEDKTQASLTTKERTDICTAFMQTVNAGGYLSGVYSSYYWYNHNLELDVLQDNGEIWMAYWTYNTYTTDTFYGLWQYTSKGRVDGIKTNVDMNVAFTDYPALVKALGLNGYAPENDLVYGDLNRDNDVSMLDVVYLQKYMARLITSLDSIQSICADVNCDGEISMHDITAIQKYLANFIDKLPIVPT